MRGADASGSLRWTKRQGTSPRMDISGFHVGVDGSGITTPEGGFHIDAWRPVAVNVVTHGHADHARPGSGRYVAAESSVGVLRRRLGQDADIETRAYGEPFDIGGSRLSLHPAGHVLGSAQVRIEHGRGVSVVAGDFKRDSDRTCAPFEVVPCDEFVTEATFALPIYRWRPTDEVAGEVLSWWRGCAESGRIAVVFAYALGKAQRVIAELGAHGPDLPGPIFTHGAVEVLVEAYREAGVDLPRTRLVEEGMRVRGAENPFDGGLVVAPPSAAGSPWMRRFGARASTGFASGWMRVRGIRRRRGYDRGFVLSDHADWPGLLETVRATGARRVLCTHGYSAVLARFLREGGLEAGVLGAAFGEEEDG